MSVENITLYDLLNLSIGTPQKGAVNFGALHALLHAMLRHLDIRELKTRWRDSLPGGEHHDAPVGVTAPADEEEGEEESQIPRVTVERPPGTELQERSSCGPAADGPGSLRTRIHTCEQEVSKAMKLIQELQSQRAGLREELKELDPQQQVVAAQPESVAAVDKCCHRVDVLEESVRSLWDTLQRYPHPEELSHCVTWDVMTSALLCGAGGPEKELVNSRASFTAVNTAPSHTSTSPSLPGQISTLDPSGPPQQAEDAPPPFQVSSSSERYPETVEALRNISKQQETFSELEAHVAALEEGKVDRSELTHLRELVNNKASQDALKSLTDQLTQQRALIDSLMSDREKLDSLEEKFTSQTSQDGETAAGASGSSDSASHELRQQITYLRKCVQKLQEDVKQLKAKQALSEERAAEGPLQDQLDQLRGTVQDVVRSLTPQLSGGLEGERDSQSLGRRAERSAVAAGSVNISRKLSCLSQHFEQLQDKVNRLHRLQAAGGAEAPKDAENTELVRDVQSMILQLQAVEAECEKLHKDSRQKQSHIEELYKMTEELEEKKADKQMVESEIKAEKSALESKVSRLQFDLATEQLTAMFHELLNKVTGHEQDWHQVIGRLSTEMERKLNRIELDSVKKQLEDRWRNIHEKLQAQGAPEHEDAAGLRKQLVDRFHCLSCDRPVVKYTPDPHAMKRASSPGFPAHKSLRLFSEQFRQHYRRIPRSRMWRRRLPQRKHAAASSCSAELIRNQPARLTCIHERLSELSDYTHLSVSRSCGGSHTATSAGQRRLQAMKHHAQPEVDGTIQSEEVDIIGLDGHIYRGRLNAPSIKNTETKLPTISTKDGVKAKDKARSCLTHKPAASPDVGHGAPPHQPHSAKSTQSSRSASSSSARDWPVSALGCTSQSSMTAAAAESATERHVNEPVDL